MQAHPPANAPQNPTNYIVDTLASQHQIILQNLTNLFNERFSAVNRLCETILKQQHTLHKNHQALAAGLQEMSNRQDDNYNKVISTLNERLPQLETSVASVSKNVDTLGRGLRQIDGKLPPLVDTTRELELTVREIYEVVKDPRAFALSSPLRYGKDDTEAAPENYSDANSFSSKRANDMHASAVVTPLPTLSFQAPSASLPVFPTDFTRIFPPSQPHIYTADLPNALPLPITQAATPASRTRVDTTTSSSLTSRIINQNGQESTIAPYLTMFPSTPGSQQKRSRNGRRITASTSPARGINGTQSSPSLSYILGSDLSDLTDSDLEDPRDQKALVVARRAKKSRRIMGRGLNKEMALVLYNPKNRPQIKKNRGSPIKGKRRYGARIAHKSNGATVSKALNVPSSPRKMDHPIRMIGCDACDNWYHSPCVGLTNEQLDQMGDEVPYTCPACPPTSTKNCMSIPNQLVLKADESHLVAAVYHSRKSGCAALRCKIPSEPAADGIFFIESLLGRKPCSSEGPSEFSWLVKFEGYALKHCLWKPEATFPAAPLIQRFYRVAEMEGMDLRRLQSSESQKEAVLLAEARRFNASWEDNGA